MVKFSFIIPTKNEEKYIKNCLDSIKKQTIKNYEIIIIDSNSTDNTLKIAKKYGKIFIERKKGPSAARNKGAKNAKGDILIFMDADVILNKNFLKILKNFKTSAVFELEFWDYKEKKTYKLYCDIFNNIMKFMFKIGKPIMSSSLFVCNKKIFDKSKGFREDLLTHEDVDLIKRIAKKEKVHLYNSKIKISARRLKKFGILNYMKEYIKCMFCYTFMNKSNPDYWN